MASVFLNRRARSSTALGALAVAAALALTGCVNPIQGVLDKVVEAQAPAAADKLVEGLTGGAVQGIGSAEVPADFPAGIPLPEGTPAQAVRLEQENGANWVLQYHGDYTVADAEAIADELLAQGYTEDGKGSLSEGMHVGLYTGDEYVVSVGLLGDADSRILQIMVMQADAG